MPRPFDQIHDWAAEAGELGAQPLRRTAGVGFVGGQRAHARDGQKVGKFLEQPRLLAIDEGEIHGDAPGLRSAVEIGQEKYTSQRRGREGA